MGMVEFRLQGDRLNNSAGGFRSLAETDRAGFRRWIGTYHALVPQRGAEAALLELGREIYAWLDGSERWLEQLRERLDGEVIPVFATGAQPDPLALQFLEIPWELAADRDGFVVAEPTIMWAPLRRIGPARAPAEPDGKHRLSALFMAAAPIGQTELDFEAEEGAILGATARAGLDLHVEDSGALDELVEHWTRTGPPEVLHLSCHGSGGAAPVLALEGPGGECREAGLHELALAFRGRWPRHGRSLGSRRWPGCCGDEAWRRSPRST